MINGTVTFVVYSLIISVLFGLFMFAVADLRLPEHVLRRIWAGAAAFVGVIGIVLMLELIGVINLGLPRILL